MEIIKIEANYFVRLRLPYSKMKMLTHFYFIKLFKKSRTQTKLLQLRYTCAHILGDGPYNPCCRRAYRVQS